MVAHKLLNVAPSITSSRAATILALKAPQSLSGSQVVTAGERFYMAPYTVQPIPLELSAAILPFVCGGSALV